MPRDGTTETREARSRRAAGLFASIVLASLVSSAPRDARAGGPLGPSGSAIETSNYGLDLFQGPVLASARVTALGGAYSALAEGAEGIPFNAASVSQRFPYSTTKTDYDITAGLTFPSSVAGTDFDNNGKNARDYGGFLFGTAGALLQHGRFGIGANIAVQAYSLDARAGDFDKTRFAIPSTSIRVFRFDAVASYAFADEQLHIGGGLRGGFVTASAAANTGVTIPVIGETLLFGSYGIGGQGGILWAPRSMPLRVGITVRSPVIGSISVAPNAETNAAGDRVIAGLYLPSGADLPWELEWGVAAQIGKRPLNIRWLDEDEQRGDDVEDERRIVAATNELEPRYLAARRLLRARYRAIPRRKLLVSASMIATGPTFNAVGIESMLSRRVERSGQRFSYTLRVGTEAEVIPHHLQLRFGSYMEPTRFDDGRARLHGTTGFELRLVEWSVFGIFADDAVWRVSAVIDGARDYFGWGVGIGLWR